MSTHPINRTRCCSPGIPLQMCLPLTLHLSSGPIVDLAVNSKSTLPASSECLPLTHHSTCYPVAPVPSKPIPITRPAVAV